MPVFRRAGIALALGLLLGCPRLAAAADCWGRWQLQLAAPQPDVEAHLSAGSWCRGKSLPRTFTLDIGRSETGRLHMAGDPLRPTDLMVGAGRCEFQFLEDTGVLPKNHELSIEVNATGGPRTFVVPCQPLICASSTVTGAASARSPASRIFATRCGPQVGRATPAPTPPAGSLGR